MAQRRCSTIGISYLEIDYDDTIIVLFKRGEIQDASDGNKNSNITESLITNQSIFR